MSRSLKMLCAYWLAAIGLLWLANKILKLMAKHSLIYWLFTVLLIKVICVLITGPNIEGEDV